MRDTPRSNSRHKKPYSKPLLTKVELRPEEAVLGACKTAAASGPIQATCTSVISCSTAGS
jgi:hypothetical protein